MKKKDRNSTANAGNLIHVYTNSLKYDKSQDTMLIHAKKS